MKELPHTRAIHSADRCTLKARNQLQAKSSYRSNIKENL